MVRTEGGGADNRCAEQVVGRMKMQVELGWERRMQINPGKLTPYICLRCGLPGLSDAELRSCV